MTEISVGFTIVTPGSLDPGMHFDLKVNKFKNFSLKIFISNFLKSRKIKKNVFFENLFFSEFFKIQ